MSELQRKNLNTNELGNLDATNLMAETRDLKNYAKASLISGRFGHTSTKVLTSDDNTVKISLPEYELDVTRVVYSGYTAEAAEQIKPQIGIDLVLVESSQTLDSFLQEKIGGEENFARIKQLAREYDRTLVGTHNHSVGFALENGKCKVSYFSAEAKIVSENTNQPQPDRFLLELDEVSQTRLKNLIQNRLELESNLEQLVSANAEREKKYQDHPELQQSSFRDRADLGFSYNVHIADLFNTITHGSVNSISDLHPVILDLYKGDNASDYSRDILDFLSISIASAGGIDSISRSFYFFSHHNVYVERNEKFQIVISDVLNTNLHSTIEGLAVGGEYRPTYHLVALPENSSEFNVAFIHELTHAGINMIFGNDDAKAYSGNSESAYHAAAKATLRNLAEKLDFAVGENADALSILNDLKMNSQVFQLVLASNGLFVSADMMVSLAKQYLNKEYSEDFLSQENVAELVSNELEANGVFSTNIPNFINEGDRAILQEFTKLAYGYKLEEALDRELIVRIPHLISNHVSIEKVSEYFGPLMDYWKQTITPIVSNMREAHIAECEQRMDDTILLEGHYDFCVGEVLEQHTHHMQ